jgi:hypothetical protein
MQPFVNVARCGPECSCRECVFRGPKTVSGQAGKPAAVETKYARKACGHAWQERLAVKEAG